MPNPAKPPERRQRKRDAAQGDAKKVKLEVLPPRSHAVPSPPKGISKDTAASWEALWDSDLANVVEVTDYPALRRLFKLYDQRAKAERVFFKEMLVEGSQGQPVLNPLEGAIDRFDKRIMALEDRFGLSPKARLTLGITFGDAHRSLEEMNRRLAEQADDEPDPRFS